MTGRHAATPTRAAATQPAACRVGAHRAGYPDTMKCDRCGHVPILWVQAREAYDAITTDLRDKLRDINWVYALMLAALAVLSFIGAAQVGLWLGQFLNGVR